uniref:Mediator of RNA polymerase II transcription subunit 24 n=1 Tax=Mus musculus TaxID=10090 RepID=F6XX22_MOUSE
MKVVNLKQAILQAWKERWSDYQWAINMKKFFPKGATWDILNLAGLKSAPGAGYDWAFPQSSDPVVPEVRH